MVETISSGLASASGKRNRKHETWLKRISRTMIDSGYTWRDTHEVYLKERDLAIPEILWGDSVEEGIYDMFYYFYGTVRDYAAPKALLIIEPSVEDCTTLMIYDPDTSVVLFICYRKAWNMYFDSKEELEEEAEFCASSLKNGMENNPVLKLKEIRTILQVKQE